MIEHLPCDRSLAENRRRTMKKKCWAIISCTVMLVLMLVQVSLAEDYLSCRNRCYLKFSECSEMLRQQNLQRRLKEGLFVKARTQSA